MLRDKVRLIYDCFLFIAVAAIFVTLLYPMEDASARKKAEIDAGRALVIMELYRINNGEYPSPERKEELLRKYNIRVFEPLQVGKS